LNRNIPEKNLRLSSTITTEQQVAQEKANSEKRSTQKIDLKSVEFWRGVMLLSTMTAAVLLIAYSALFDYTFIQLGNTTSYFPWSWGANYTDPASVTSLFVLGLAVGTIAFLSCETVLLLYVLPKSAKK
jgi:hypothetical protein